MSKTTQDFRVKTSRAGRNINPLSSLTQLPLSKRKLSPIRVNKYNIFMDCLNDLTHQQFDKCKSRISFQQIEEKIHKNTLLCILFIQNVQLYNNYDLPNTKIPPKFSWETIYAGKTLQLTTPQSYTRVSHGLVDFMFKSNSKKPLKLKLWKVKNYEESYIGEIELSVADFVDFEQVLEFQGKIVKETFVQKEMLKVFNDKGVSIGQVSLKIIQFCSSSMPSNKLSNIPGSPRSSDQRKKHNMIEEGKNKGFDWGSSREEEYIIQLIQEAFLEVKSTTTIEEVQKKIAEIHSTMDLLMSLYNEPVAGYKRANIGKLKKRQQQIMGVMDQLMKLEDQYIQQLNNLRNIGRKVRIRKQDIDSALQQLGCTAQELVFCIKDDFGMCLMDYLLDSDSFPEIILLFNELCSEQTLDQFAKSLFDNIRQRLRKNHYLKALSVFLKGMNKFPEIGLIIQQYAYSEDNAYITETIDAPFCLEFNIDDYSHVIVLSKIRKLSKLYLPTNVPFMISLERTYQKAKKHNYFRIPMLPKNVTEEKRELLFLPELNQNIFHEIVRRKRWNLFSKTYMQFEEMVYQQDFNGVSPMMLYLENAPLDLILQLENLKDQISQKNNKTSIHFLLMNPDLSVSTLSQVITKFNILNDKVWMTFTPLALFLERLVHKQKKHKSRIIKEMKAALENTNKKIQIIDMLSSHVIQKLKQFNIPRYLLYSQNVDKKEFADYIKEYKQTNEFPQHHLKLHEWDSFHHYHTIPALMLCRLDENILELIWNQFSWINWLAPKMNYPFDRYTGSTLMNSLCQTTQYQLISQYLQKETPIQYRDHEGYMDEDKYNYQNAFQSLLSEESLSAKIREDINKKYKIQKDVLKEDKVTMKNLYSLMAQNQFKNVIDILSEQIDQIDRSIINSFKFQCVVTDLIPHKNASFAKLFRKAFDCRYMQPLNFVDLLIKALSCNNMQAAHLSLYFAVLRNNLLKRATQLKSSQMVYINSLLTHWSLELDLNQFQMMLIDIKDVSTQNELNQMIYILGMNGRHQKLKLVIDRMTNQNYLIQALPIAAHQLQSVRNEQYYEQLKDLLRESDIRKLYHEDAADFLKPIQQKEKIKQEPKKPFEKAKPIFCKWLALQGAIQNQLQQLYKLSQSNSRLRNEQTITQKAYLQFYYQEYQYKLRRLFPRQNFRSIFYQAKARESDFVRTIDLLIDKILQMKLTPSDEFFNYIHVHDKFSELLSQSPNQNICIVMAFKSMINLFEHPQTQETLSKCITFLKKYLNSKIYKDLNELNEPLPFEKDQNEKQKKKIEKTIQEKFLGFLKKNDINNIQNKFAVELLLLMDQNFTTQEFESINIIGNPAHCANQLIKLKSTDKRIMAFLQKYLNTGSKNLALPFNAQNMDYIITLSKQGLNLLQDNSIEYLLSHGHHLYLKQYFLNAQGPKGMLNDDQKLYYLQFAIQSCSPETIQLCIEALCQLKNNELKQMFIDGNLFVKAMSTGSTETLLFIIKKIFKLCVFTSQDIYKLLSIKDGVCESYDKDKDRDREKEKDKKERLKGKPSPLPWLFLTNGEIVYKEFFVDFLQKVLPNEYKSLINTIFTAKVESEEHEPTIFQSAIQVGFYDVIQTCITLNLQIDLTFIESLDLMLLPTRWLLQTPQFLENLLKQESYKVQFKQTPLKLYRICKYHLIRNTNPISYFKKLEIGLNLIPLLQQSQASPHYEILDEKDNILDIILENQIDPQQKPLLFLMKMLLDQEDKNNGFLMIESFCDKHPQIMHDKFYTQIIKNREAYELLRIYYPEKQVEINYEELTFKGTDNFVQDYLLLQDPIKFIGLIVSPKQIVYCMRVIYDKNLSLETFYNNLQIPSLIWIASLCLLILNNQKYQQIVFNKLELQVEDDLPMITIIFKELIKFNKSIEGTYFYFIHLIEQMFSNVIYQQLILMKPVGDLNNPIISERKFLDEIKLALSEDSSFTLPDNIWSQIIQSSTKTVHALQADKWFHGLCLFKTIFHVCYGALSVIHEIKASSYLDNYIEQDYWGIEKAQFRIIIDLYLAADQAQPKVVLSSNSKIGNWEIKYPLGLVKDNHYIYPFIMTSQKGTEFAKHQIIKQTFEQTNQKELLQNITNFTFEGVSYDNIQILRKEEYEIINNQINLEGELQYGEQTLATNYVKRKKQFSITPTTNSILVQMVSKDEFNKKEKAIHIFNQAIEDPSKKNWFYYVENQKAESIKEDQILEQLYQQIITRLPDCQVNFASFIECYFMKIAIGLEKTYKKAILPKVCIDLGMQWDLLNKLIKTIRKDLSKFQNVCFEMAEIDPKKTFNIKLDGFDSIFRFGQSELFIFHQFVVVRLNIAIISQNFNNILNNTPLKVKINEVKDLPDIQSYWNSIYNISQVEALIEQ